MRGLVFAVPLPVLANRGIGERRRVWNRRINAESYENSNPRCERKQRNISAVWTGEQGSIGVTPSVTGTSQVADGSVPQRLPVRAQPIPDQSREVDEGQAVPLQACFRAYCRKVILESPVSSDNLTAPRQALAFRRCLQPVPDSANRSFRISAVRSYVLP